MFVGVHMMLAARTGMEELAITMDEGDAFMKAAQNVLRHYSVETTQKTLDWIAFAGTAGSIYGTRFAAVMMRRRFEQPKKPHRKDGNVIHAFGPTGNDPLHFEMPIEPDAGE